MERSFSRRTFLGGVATAAATPILAACGGSGAATTPTASGAITGGGVATTFSGVVGSATAIANRPTATPAATAAPVSTAVTSSPAPAATAVPVVATPQPAGTITAAGSRVAGAVYALTNQEAANAVAVFARGTDGTLTMMTTIPTGGRGSGDQQDTEALGSQGALALTADGKLLFAANGGSGDITVFAARENTLSFLAKVPSNGPRPISLTIHGDVLYALNYDRQKPGKGNITAFAIGRNGGLAPIADSTKPLSSNGNVDPGQVLFSPRGDLLVVTEKATNKVVTYPVGPNGIAGAPSAQPSGGEAPFSLTFVNDGLLVTADNFGDAEGKGAASSFSIGPKGALKLVSKAVPAGLTGACWIVATADGTRVYVANTGSGIITAYTVGQDGSLALLNADGITARAGKKPRDLALSADGRFLYALDSLGGTVESFAVQPNGALESLGATGSIPVPGANGLVAR